VAERFFGKMKNRKGLTGKKDTTQEAPSAMGGEEREKGWLFF